MTPITRLATPKETQLKAYAVKHIVKDRGPLARIMKAIRKTPSSYTSKEPEAWEAIGNDIYVFEVRLEKAMTSYWLGYKYRACEKFELAGGRLWDEEFKYKNSSIPGERADGVYFEPPARLDDNSLIEWLSSKQPGMAEIPFHLVPALDRLVGNPINGATRFT